MQENSHPNKGRTALMILLPTVCLLILAALVLATLHVVGLYRRTNEALLVYKAYARAEQYLQAESDRLTEQARMFVYSGDTRFLDGYFRESETVRHGERAGEELRSSGDPVGMSEPLAALKERSAALRGKELHAMKLAAVSFGLDISGMPAAAREYPLEEWEARLVSEQMRDEAYELLYGEAYCEERTAIDEAREALFSEAEQKTEERVYGLSREIDVTLNLQRLLLGVSVAAIAGLILFLYRQRKLDAAYEASRREELEKAKQRAEAEDRTKTAFLLNISHDIRTPMNEILGFTNLAEKHIDERDKVESSLKKIRSSGGHLLNIVNDILELNRIENSALEIVESAADVMRCGEEIQSMLLSQAEAKGIDYALVIRDITDRYVYVDIMHMVRVLINLVTNAIRFTPEGGRVRLEVEQVSPVSEGRAEYRFTVSDTGVGMSREFVQRLFDAYAREKTTDALPQGAGLGLTITKKLVDRMGGTITVESEQGKGSVFTVTMPFRVQSEEEVEENYGEGTGKVPGRSLQSLENKRVLLADDNELAREISAEVLRSEGAQTEKAENGADALRLFTEKPEGYFDLILMDTYMPVMNGFEAAAQIRALASGRDIPIIAIASAPREEDKVNALAAGMNAMLTKPVDIGELSRALHKFC